MKENLHSAPVHIQHSDKIPAENTGEMHWVLMRSQQAKVPVAVPGPYGKKARTILKYGYENAQDLFHEFFMPVKETVAEFRSRRVIRQQPAIPGIFFVRDTIREILVQSSRGLGFGLKYVKGRPYREPVILRDDEMENFIRVLKRKERVMFFSPDDPRLNTKVNRRVRINQGDSSIEGFVISVRGSRKRWLRIGLENCLVAEMEIDLHALEESGQVIEMLD